MFEDNKPDRTDEEIKNLLTLAKLNENDLSTTTQTIYFAPSNVHNNNYKLLELDKHLQDTLKEGSSLYVTGDDDDNVVICSETCTYNVREAETSNSLLLVQGLKFSESLNNAERIISRVNILGIFYNYLEPSLSKPYLKKLTDLLAVFPYKGPEFEQEIVDDDLFSYKDLVERIQASETELKEALQSLNIVTINSKIRLLDFEYHFRVLSYMLKLIDENSWRLDEIDCDETMNALCDLVPKEVLESMFEFYTEPTKVIDGTQLFTYKETEICRFFAQVLLHEAGKFNLDEFLQAWQESVPEGMITNEEMLYGIALINRKTFPNVIWAFPEDRLPENITERFQILFDAKEKWTVPEIAPYIRCLSTPKFDVNALLSKYARSSTVNGVKYYSAKHAK